MSDKPSERLQIEWECERLCREFFLHIDRDDIEGVAGLFAPDGVFVRHGVPLRGRKAIIETLQKRGSRVAGRTTMHLSTNFVASSVSSTQVEATSYGMVISAADTENVTRFDPMRDILALAVYDKFCVSEGRWRFLERVTQSILCSPNWYTARSQ